MSDIDSAFDKVWAERGFKDTALADKSAMKELVRQFYGRVEELEQQLSAVTAERDEAKEAFEIVKQQHLHAIKEVSSLRARIAEAEPVGVGARWPTDLDKRILHLLWTDGEIEEAVSNGMEAVKLYASPITSPDTQEWPKLDKPAKVGNCRFGVGVSARLVVESAKRLYEYEVTPEKEAERIANASALSFTDTQELIRNAVDEEREACAKICDAQASEWDSDSVQTYKNYAGFCSSAIRSRSTKEK